MLDPRRAAGWLSEDFGEDWAVPRAEVRYLVTRDVGPSLLLTAYGRDGQVVGERLFADATAGSEVMRRLLQDELVEPWRDIPEDRTSATRFLDS